MTQNRNGSLVMGELNNFQSQMSRRMKVVHLLFDHQEVEDLVEQGAPVMFLQNLCFC